MRLTIHNFRVGFATNSSSSHSLILIPDAAVGSVTDLDANGDFGWGYFRCASTEAKMRYLAAQLFSSAYSQEDRDRFIETFSKYVPNIAEQIPQPGENSWDGDYLSIDHQSKMFAPTKYEARVIDPMVKVFLDPRLVVLGGNDNSDETFNEVGGQQRHPLNDMIRESSTVIVRPDAEYVVMFNRHDGNKVRLSVSPNAAPYTKASVPELVDLKITDYCGANCRFCYQGSTRDGVHAPLDEIKRIIDMLSDLQVFEVAIGGGEPTDHPDFAEILAYCALKGVMPNFTTMSDRWFDNAAIVEAVKQHVGGIGVSCSSEKGIALVEAVKAKVGSRWGGKPHILLQHVLGSVPLHTTGALLSAAFSRKLPVLLLGFKEVGFGTDYQRHDTEEGENVPFFLKMAVQRHPESEVSLSVDTALIDQYPALPAALGAPKVLVTSPEGKFSCYIDAVKWRMAASSYGDVESTDVMPASTEDFLRTFSKY